MRSILALLLIPLGAVASPDNGGTPPPGPQREAPRFSAFGTLALAQTQPAQGWRFAREITQPGARAESSLSPDSRLGLQLNWSLQPELELVAQVVARERPDASPAAEALELAFIAYRPSENLQLRLGRVTPDIFLFANARSIGIALPWIRPPVEFYGWMPFISLDGAEASYQWRDASAYWQVKLGAGRTTQTAAGLWTGSPEVKASLSDALSLTLTTQSGGLLLKASTFMVGKTRIEAIGDAGRANWSMLTQGLAQLAQSPLPLAGSFAQNLLPRLKSEGSGRYAAFAVQYQSGAWEWLAELSRARALDSMAEGLRGYASVGYRIGNTTVFALAARSRPAHAAAAVADVQQVLAPVLGPQAAAQVQGLLDAGALAANAQRFDQRGIGMGLRWDFSQDAALKVQVDRTRVGSAGAGNWAAGTLRPGSATVFSIGVDFAWRP